MRRPSTRGMFPDSAGAAMERRSADAAVAEAMNRVLAAESEAAAAIAAAQRDAEAVIEVARGRRRQVLDAARRRASRLHAKAQERLAAELHRLDHEAPAAETGLATLRDLTRAAVDRLVGRLTSDDHESP